ncbi:MAG: succinate dehydrogenase iron-sulfur subunit [Chloroflexi bacterium]|nr:succinate dehydrogenase iron-sulfur subunit [Chloroflexota bacterium]
MSAKQITFKVQRFDPKADDVPHYQEYTLDIPEGMTILEALLRIQAEQDGSLSFRYACRGAVCGSCAMVINGQIDLACRSQVRGLDTETVTVEPLPNMPVLKDLVVDMEPFFEKNRAVQPWLQPTEPDPEKERLVDPVQWAEAEPYTNCILCASCYGVCPAAERDSNYLGPAALAKHYRFLADVRDVADDARVALVDSEQGIWGCDMVWSCVEVCPKGVSPTQGIGKTRAHIRRAQRARDKQQSGDNT